MFGECVECDRFVKEIIYVRWSSTESIVSKHIVCVGTDTKSLMNAVGVVPLLTSILSSSDRQLLSPSLLTLGSLITASNMSEMMVRTL